MLVLLLATAHAMQPCTWTLTPSDNTPSTFNNRLEDVIGFGADEAWAVGQGDGQAMIQRWDGTSWTRVPLNVPPTVSQSHLWAIDGSGPNDLWAVGYAITSQTIPLTLHYDGNQWRYVPSPRVRNPFTINSLNDVHVLAPDDVWAVGGDFVDGANRSRSVLMHFDGTAWSLTNPPSAARTWTESTRYGVVALGPREVWAVGDGDPFRWDGRRWSVVQDAVNQSSAIAAGSRNNIWAVGTEPATYIASSGVRPATAQIQVWDGSGWQVQTRDVPLSNLGDPTNLRAVAAASPSLAWAVGHTSDFTYIQFWDGMGWSTVQGADVNLNPTRNRGDENVLRGVSADGPDAVWAVGYSRDNTGNQTTLAQRCERTP